MDKFNSVSVGKQYATYQSEEKVYDCPACKEEAVEVCPCGYSDKTCKNGHIWYTDREGKCKLGNPH